jgi:hypothetical protein
MMVLIRRDQTSPSYSFLAWVQQLTSRRGLPTDQHIVESFLALLY